MKKMLFACLQLPFFLLLRAQDCQPIVSEARVASTDLAAAVATLNGAGADVRVRIVQSLGSYATLDALEAALVRSCPTWQAPGGGTKNNLIVFAVAIEQRKSGLYYGSQWRELLDANGARVRTQFMNPRFAGGNWVGGVAAGATEVRRLILQLQSVGTGTGTTVIQTPTAPTDFSGLWSVLGFALGLAGVIWLLVFFIRARRELNQEEQERAEAQQGALIAQQEATTLVVASAEWTLEKSAKSQLDAAIAEYGELGVGAMDPKRDGLSKGQYVAIQKRYREVATALRGANWAQQADKLTARTDALESRGGTRVSSSPKSKKTLVTTERVVERHDHHHYDSPSPSVVIVDNSSYVPPSFYTPPATATPTPSHPSSWGSSSDSDSSSSGSSGGSSSSWGSSDSSSSYDSGSSSSFDSGSSSCDSGGGSSSDF